MEFNFWIWTLILMQYSILHNVKKQLSRLHALVYQCNLYSLNEGLLTPGLLHSLWYMKLRYLNPQLCLTSIQLTASEKHHLQSWRIRLSLLLNSEQFS